MRPVVYKVTSLLATTFALLFLAQVLAEGQTEDRTDKDSHAGRIDPFANDSVFESDEFQKVKAHRLSRFWENSDTQPQYLQAECGACHRTLKVAGAPLLNRGRKLIRERGCVGCHDVGDVFESIERGPNLDDIGNKTERAWLYNWIKDPSIYLPQPGMPSFRFEEEQVLYLIEFLMSLDSKDSPPLPVEGDPLEDGDPDRGNVLVRESRCITCHSIHERGGRFAPELELVGDKVRPKWLVNFLRNVHYYQPEKQMLEFNFSEQDALDITAYIFEEFSEEEFEFPYESSLAPFIPDSLSQEERVATGEGIFLAYGCRGCHTVADIPKLKVAPSLSEIAVRHEESISFGIVDDASHNLANWIFMKVSDPDGFSEMLNMPDFSFSEEEALAITVALLANKPMKFSEEWLVHEPEKRAYATPDEDFAALLEKYSCLSCHRIEGVGGDISTAPLTYEGSKVQYQWLKDYLIRPHAVRPTLTERMPLFRMTEEEAVTMANFIKSVYVTEQIPSMSVEEFTEEEVSRGKVIYENKRCVSCHITNKAGGYVGPQLDDVGSRLEPGWIYAWMKSPIEFRPGTVQPDYGFSDDEARALAAYLMTFNSATHVTEGE